jgi:hypothetical protein
MQAERRIISNVPKGETGYGEKSTIFLNINKCRRARSQILTAVSVKTTFSMLRRVVFTEIDRRFRIDFLGN